MQLILLAAGRGSRLPKIFRKKPKCQIKISGKTLLEHNVDFYKKFSKKIIVTGFKHKKLKLFIKENQFKEVRNFYYKKTNMVHSLFCVKSIKKEDVVVCYGDIIFDKNIFSNLNKNDSNSIILLKKNWLRLWKGRMGYNNIKDDAEDVEVDNNNLVSIGNKIKDKLPKYQYTGIMKFKNRDFFKLKKFFKKIKNKKIDFTSFLNKAIKSNIIKMKIISTSKFWYEIDTIQDIKFTERNLW
jgi:choline kinase